jgi:hypothetical protein
VVDVLTVKGYIWPAMSTKPDTRQIPDDIIQAAMNKACANVAATHDIYLNALDLKPGNDYWEDEAPARLALARALLARLPEPTKTSPPAPLGNAKAHAEFQAELESVWNGDSWTPKVGDVVRLTSGGDALTVTEYDAEKNQWRCVGLTGGCPCYVCVPAACLTPAKEAQP